MKTRVGNIAVLAFVVLALGVLQARADDPAYVQILSATVRDQKIAAAAVILQENGRQSVATATDTAGRARLPDAASRDPGALLIVRKEGYSDLVVRCPCGGMSYAISPVLESLDGMRIVLNWGRRPNDLDGHLAFGTEHVFFLNKTGSDATLDVDHMDGFGPETITVSRRHLDERYVYAVQDFSDKATSTSAELARSDAKVFIYVGQTLIRTYYVPKDRIGNLWTVFAISEAGEIQDINTMSGIQAQTPSDMTTELVFGGHPGNPGAVTPVAVPRPSARVPDGARRLNTQGETAYREGNYPHAIELFQSAIAQDDDYGQAYSDLGLVYQKVGRVAEALWANRKAIVLASGSSAATTRASTHFNNGRIYENARQWDDALREYERAASEKSNPVYDSAIQRMRQQAAH